MSEITFPKPCALCVKYMAAKDAPQAAEYSVAVGDVCPECKRHTERAFAVLKRTAGITPWPLPDHEKRNNSAVINCTDMHQRRRNKA